MEYEFKPKMDWNEKNLTYSWRKCEEYMNLMFKGPLKESTPKEKSAYVRLWIGEEGREIIRSWTLSKEEIENPKTLICKLREYFIPEKINTKLTSSQDRQQENE